MSAAPQAVTAQPVALPGARWRWFVRASNGIVVDRLQAPEPAARLWFARREDPQWSHTDQLVAWTNATAPLLGMGTLDDKGERMAPIDLPVCKHCHVRHASVAVTAEGELKYSTSCGTCQKQAFEGL